MQEKLNVDNDTIANYFDRWPFESFDDAKMVLISGIVEKLENEKKFTSRLKNSNESTFKN